jgi:hypothetical protein
LAFLLLEYTFIHLIDFIQDRYRLKINMNSTLQSFDEQLINGLGICEYCSTVLCVRDIPEGIDIRTAACPACNRGPLSLSFTWGLGPDPKDLGDRTNCKQLKWVGPDGKWTNTIPTENFLLPRLGLVIV